MGLDEYLVYLDRHLPMIQSRRASGRITVRGWRRGDDVHLFGLFKEIGAARLRRIAVAEHVIDDLLLHHAQYHVDLRRAAGADALHLVAGIDGALVARLLAVVRPAPMLEVIDLQQDRQAQRRGIGPVLVRALQDCGAARGWPVGLRLAAHRERARYEKSGFRISRREDRSRGPDLMWNPAAPAAW